MAEAEYSDFQSTSQMYEAAPVQEEAPRGGGFMHWIGAIISIALLIGLGVWGYQLAVRDVSGIPVVRALDGPMRVQPDDPGGEQARHQGLAVNQVQAEGEAAPTADTLILAPPPIDLIAADQPVSDSRPTPRVTETEASATPAIQASFSEATETVSADSMSEEERALALVDQIAAGVEPLQSATETAPETIETAVNTAVDQILAGSEDTENATNPDVIAASIPGVSRSLRPTARPAIDVASLGSSAEQVQALESGSSVREIDPASIPVGTRLVQLGAYDTSDIAIAQWDVISRQFADYFGGKARVVEKANRAGRDFYRLRVHGFEDLSDARRFCAVLIAKDTDCIPVSFR